MGSLALFAAPATGADFDAACCADLEQRIADLEAASVRTGRRNIELKLSGAVNRAVLVWDDGEERNAYAVTGDNDNTVLTAEGEADNLGSGWSVGFVFDFDVLDAGSSDVSQVDTRGTREIQLGELSLWIKNERLGEISIGKTSAKGSSGGANELDLSGTEAASYVGIADIGGGFLLRRADLRSPRGLLGVSWDDLIDSLDEPDGNVIAYDSPELYGVSVSAFWGADDIWNVAAGTKESIGGQFEIAAAIAYNENLQGQLDDLPDHKTVSGSISVLHTPSGLSLTYASGWRAYMQPVQLNDGTTATPGGPSFGYLKAGWRTNLIPLGDTATYAEYGRFRDFLSEGADAGKVEGLGGLAPGTACTSAGVACFVSGSDASIWGLGVVQFVDNANAQVYLGYRHLEAGIGLTDSQGGKVKPVPLTGLDTLMAGMLIEF